jgi:UDPglucose 6-dehydrogenase
VNIVVVGLGYVGTANAIALAQDHHVVGLDIDPERVEAINAGRSPVEDDYADRFMIEHPLDLCGTTDAEPVLRAADIVVVATPTDYDPGTNRFDTASVEAVATRVVALNPNALVVVRSTVPVGYVRELRSKLATDRIIFVPEFLREGRALRDTLEPSRIIVGDTGEAGRLFANLLTQAARKADIPILLTEATEAEAIKLFANTFLAMRVAYFNELDSYAMSHGLDTRQIIEGVGLDPRIGSHYNNPSFGFGGYCLPKDTKQLLANYSDVPQNLIGAIVDANRTRKDLIAEAIIARQPKCVGIYRLIMKQGSDNVRQSAVQGIMKRLKAKGIRVMVYEPALSSRDFFGSEVVGDLEQLKTECDLIVANRLSPEIMDLREKVFTRDLFGSD